MADGQRRATAWIAMGPGAHTQGYGHMTRPAPDHIRYPLLATGGSVGLVVDPIRFELTTSAMPLRRSTN